MLLECHVIRVTVCLVTDVLFIIINYILVLVG